MTEKELKIRTRKFAVDILNFVDKLPDRRSGNIIGNQLGRSASSVAANYRAASIDEVEPLLKEARELTTIFTAASKTAKQNKVR